MPDNQLNEKLLKVTKEDVAYLASLYGLNVGEEDLAEVTFRLTALFDEVVKLNQLDLSQVEPIPIFLPAEGD